MSLFYGIGYLDMNTKISYYQSLVYSDFKIPLVPKYSSRALSFLGTE